MRRKDDSTSESAPEASAQGLSRRGFLASAGASAVAVACRPQARPELEPEVREASTLAKVELVINGRKHALLVEPRWSLLYVLREKLGLTGTKVGCERGECGACTVLIDDRPFDACMLLAVELEGKRVTTLEGLLRGEALGPTQRAFAEEDAFQCGYCTPGQVMSVEGLLRAQPAPSLEAIREGLAGNLCRCGTYPNIVRAAERAARIRQEEAGDGK